MTRDIPGIVARELGMNVDFMLRLKDNLASGLFRLPGSMMVFIADKYDVSLQELESCHDQILEGAISALKIPTSLRAARPVPGPSDGGPQPKRIVVVHRRKPKKTIAI